MIKFHIKYSRKNRRSTLSDYGCHSRTGNAHCRCTKQGKTRSLTLLVNQESSFRVSTAQTIAAGLSRYDLQVTVRSLPYDEYVQALEQGDIRPDKAKKAPLE